MQTSAKTRVFYWGSPNSPFVSEHVEVALQEGFEVYWYFHQAFTRKSVASFYLPGATQNKLIRAVYEPLFISSLLKKLKPDLVHLFYASKGASIWPIAKHHPLVISLMGSDITPGIGYKVPYQYFIKKALSSADLILSKSEYMDRAVMKIGDYRSKLTRLSWGVDTQMFTPLLDTSELRRRLGIPQDSLVFFDPRNARPLYNKHVIVRAFAEFLKASQTRAVLLISEQLASPGYLHELRSFVEEAGISANVRFVGTVPFEEMPAHYALADAVVSIPQSDGLPQSLYEAMAAGCALILSALPQYDELIALGMQASKVHPGDVEELANSMLYLAQELPRKQAAAANRQVAVQFMSLRQSQKELTRLYRKLLLAADV